MVALRLTHKILSLLGNDEMQKVSELIQELEALEARVGTLDELTNKIDEQRKILANLEIETERTAKHLADLRDERLNFQTALNKTRAELATAQNNLTATQAAYEETRTKILKAIG